MPSFDTKDEEFIIMLLAMGELELGELVELLDDVKEIPRPFPIRLQQIIFLRYTKSCCCFCVSVALFMCS